MTLVVDRVTGITYVARSILRQTGGIIVSLSGVREVTLAEYLDPRYRIPVSPVPEKKKKLKKLKIIVDKHKIL